MFENTDIIDVYTRKQALLDKAQFNIDTFDPKIRTDKGIKYPVFITDTVMNIVRNSARISGDTVEWILFDICNMFTCYAKNNRNSSEIKFLVAIKYLNRKNNIDVKDICLYAQIGAMDFDDVSPVITIMDHIDL